MNAYFNFKHSFRKIDFAYACKPTVDEREIHSYHEILYYIGGDATLLCESFSKQLSPNTLILIPKGSYHFFKCDKPESFERLKISFTHIDGFERSTTDVMNGIRVFDELDSDVIALFDSICQKLKSGGGEESRSAFLLGALMILLSTFDKNEKIAPDNTRDRLISNTIEYIESNLKTPLYTETVANAVKVSPSTLSHVFKREMGISLHKYIAEKRLIFACRLIDEGNLPTKIFADCGFGDYSSFYKAYIGHFGHPPSGRESRAEKLPKI